MGVGVGVSVCVSVCVCVCWRHTIEKHKGLSRMDDAVFFCHAFPIGKKLEQVLLDSARFMEKELVCC